MIYAFCISPLLTQPPSLPHPQRLCILTSLLLHHDDFICINVSQDDDGTHDAGYGGVEERWGDWQKDWTCQPLTADFLRGPFSLMHRVWKSSAGMEWRWGSIWFSLHKRWWGSKNTDFLRLMLSSEIETARVAARSRHLILDSVH